MPTEQIPRELVQYESDFLSRRRGLNKNNRNTLSVENTNQMSLDNSVLGGSLNNSILSVGGKSPRPNTQAIDKRRGGKQVAYMVPRREGSIDSMSMRGPNNSLSGRLKGLLLSPQHRNSNESGWHNS